MGCIVFGLREEEVTGEWRKPYELNDLYSSLCIVWVIRMRWAGHVARMGEGEVCKGYCRGNLKERDHL
jgi:hypothetical protein